MVFCISKHTISFCKHYKVLFCISDYESLRIGGLVFAVVLFFMGIALIVSKCLTTLSTQRMCNGKCQCHHTDPCMCELTSRLPKQVGFCFSQRSGREAHWCLLHNLSTQHSQDPCITAVCPLYLIPFLTQCPSNVPPPHQPAHAVTASASPETKTNQ